MTTRGEGIAVIYGRAHDSVTALHAVMKGPPADGLARP